MLISDLEQFELLSKSRLIVGGMDMQFNLDEENDGSIVKLIRDGKPILNRRLPRGKSLVYKSSISKRSSSRIIQN